ncbi:hypothetical protein AWB68_03159 [Caballeronia choica]|uniref:Uncharacterized protein n=1 Tax=Caballeronia choica TaxID=326476 RepID=A0A158IWX5_9BURK|nr:hypothetical protein AWB68_03159 [Caballeronia choica]
MRFRLLGVGYLAAWSWRGIDHDDLRACAESLWTWPRSIRRAWRCGPRASAALGTSMLSTPTPARAIARSLPGFSRHSAVISGCERTMQASNSRIQLTTIRAMQPRPRLMSDLRVHATDGRDMTLAGCAVACARANIRRDGDGFVYGSPGRTPATGHRRRGPARTHPARAAPDAISASISVSPKPTSDKISRVCSPMPGAGPRIAEGVLPNSAAGVG